MSSALSAPVSVSIVCWCAFESGLAVRDLVRRKGSLRRDRGTKLIISVALVGAVLLGAVARHRVPALDIPAREACTVVGLVVLWLGLALRAWAVLLITAGLGIASANWLSLLVTMALPTLGILPRIAVEEAELVRVLGEPYRQYRARTRRIIPLLW